MRPHQAGNSLMYPASVTGRLRCRETRVRFPGHSGAGFSETFAQAEPFDVGWETMLEPTASPANWV